MKLTAVIGRTVNEYGNALQAQLYSDGRHIGYAKVDSAYVKVITKALEAAGFAVIETF